MYVNVFANLVEDTKMAERDREASINIVSLFVSLGIVTSSLFELLMSNTFLPPDAKASC